ncbi:hypothetical protein GCM10009799_44700 [Nocardiopsis rhodophaea]|uniref:OmpR/PhoB-type domain-containing protein n=1 Tax=Nocardiopsis rhodophaea TaxID=280238 RepID=A0ABP5F0Y3_9ACTN
MIEHEFRILGPLDTFGSEGRVAIKSARIQILLAMLLMNANRVVGGERLIDAIWGEAPPDSVTSQLRICVSGLRRQLKLNGSSARIETHPSGYLIRVPDDALDLSTFHRMVDRSRRELEGGRIELAAALMRSALGLWRGSLCEGLDSRLLRSVARKEEEERLLVTEEYFDLQLLLGRHRRIIGELTSFAAENPFRETPAAQLMLALHRSGRQADALDVYRDLRERFSQQLGIDPTESLRELHHLILKGDGVTAFASSRWAVANTDMAGVSA